MTELIPEKFAGMVKNILNDAMAEMPMIICPECKFTMSCATVDLKTGKFYMVKRCFGCDKKL